MSRRSRTGEVDPIPAPDTARPAVARPVSPGFDFGDIDAAIGDLTADVQAGPVDAVQLETEARAADPGDALAELVGMAELDDDLKFTDEHLPVPEPVAPSVPPMAAPAFDPEPPPMAASGFEHGPPPPDAGPPPASLPPAYAQAPAPPMYDQASAPPPYAQPAPAPAPAQYAQASAPPPYQAPAPAAADPFDAPDPSGPVAPPRPRPIQNVETAYVRNPLLAPQAPAPAAPADPYAPTAGQPEVGTPPRGRLVVHGGDWNGTTWYLNRAETRLGRGEENDIVVLDIGVSRHHLVLARHAQGFRLIDLQSGNGTYVNGRRVSEVELYDGDRVDLGHTSLVFTTVGPPRQRPPGAAGEGRGRQLPTSWLVLMALTTFFTVLGTMYLVRSLKGDGGPPQAMEAARQAMTEHDWTAARAALEAARADGVDDAELAGLEARISQEEDARRRIEKARSLMGDTLAEDAAQAMPETLEAELRSIPATSVYYGETLVLMQQARQLRTKALLDEAERLMDEGKSVLARVKVRAVLKDEPGNVRAKALRRSLDELENR